MGFSYDDALEFIHGTYKFGIKLGLENIGKLLELMGNPHKHLKYVHVAGTNGKGSTVAFLSSILMEAGYKVGIYTSPYLERFTERIRINGEEIPEADLARITLLVKQKIEDLLASGFNHPTEFEVVTSIAFQYYFEKKCDIVVLEVGLGGRFDSTNVIDTPLASVITTINYDHMDILGDTLEKIAFEKAGIIKQDGVVVLYPQPCGVEKVFADVASSKGAVIHKADFSRLKVNCSGIDGVCFDYKDFKSLRITLPGDFQARNAAVAVETVEVLRSAGWNISDDALRAGLLNTKWAGRFEVVAKNPVFIIDVAHNRECATALYSTLNKYFPGKKVHFIVGVLKDKDYEQMIRIVLPAAAGFFTVTPSSSRALDAKELANFIKSHCNDVTIGDRIDMAIEGALSAAGSEGIICAFGSHYFLGEVRKYIIDRSGVLSL